MKVGMLKSSSADSLLALAEAGDGRAMFDLAERHRHAATNDGLGDSWPEAHRWYRRAINAGVASAAYELGVCLLEARGVPMDVDLGFTWVQRATQFPPHGRPDNERGREIACLGDCYLRGIGVAKDESAAAALFARAAELGDSGAQLKLALCFARGNGLPRDDTAAEVWARRAQVGGAAEASELIDAIAKGCGSSFVLLADATKASASPRALPDGTQRHI